MWQKTCDRKGRRFDTKTPKEDIKEVAAVVLTLWTRVSLQGNLAQRWTEVWRKTHPLAGDQSRQGVTREIEHRHKAHRCLARWPHLRNQQAKAEHRITAQFSGTFSNIDLKCCERNMPKKTNTINRCKSPFQSKHVLGLNHLKSVVWLLHDLETWTGCWPSDGATGSIWMFLQHPAWCFFLV